MAVLCPASMTILAQNGCYGKGTHSRSIPMHVSRQDDLKEPTEKKANLEEEVEMVSRSESMRIVTDVNKVSMDTIQPGIEYLQLSGEEALYLCHEVGCLQVVSPDQNATTYSPVELWNLFRTQSPHFVELYVTYCYYRRKGWVPKSGLKYGMQYVLYRGSPEMYHSSYGVLVRPCEGLGAVGGDRTPGLRWQDVIAASRVSESVGKNLVVCSVMRVTTPTSGEEGTLELPNSARDFVVCEVFVTRKIPEKEL